MSYPIIVNNVEVGTFERIVYSEGFGHALITSNHRGIATDSFVWVESLNEAFRFRADAEVIALIKDASITRMSLADFAELYDQYGQ